MKKTLYLLHFWLLSSPLQAEILEGFEGKHNWQIADWGDEAKIEVTTEAFSEGEKALKIYWVEGAKRRGKGMVIERDISALNKDFSSLRMDIHLPDIASAQIAVAIDTDEYFESQPFELEKGWNKDVVFYLQGKTWKAKTNSWQYQSPVNLTTAPKKIYLIFYMPEQATGFFHLDNIRTGQEPQTQTSSGPQAAAQPVRSKKNHYRPRELPLEIFIRP